MPNSPPVVARMPAFVMFLGVLVIVAGLSWDAREISTGTILVNMGIAINQLILILATTNLGERNRELKAAAVETRAAVVETRADAAATREHVDAAVVEVVVLGHAIRARLERLDNHVLIGAADDLAGDATTGDGR